MATAPDDLTAHAAELLSRCLGPLRVTRLFGGWGLALEGMNLGLVIDGRLYLKADAQSLPVWQAAGCTPFSYEGRGGRTVVVKYLAPPEAALESPAEMAPWARLALDAALRARATQTARQSPRKKPAKPRSARPAARKRSDTPPRTR